jgi:hypothetical protein
MFQAEELSTIDDEQVMLVFRRHAMGFGDADRSLAGGEKALAIEAIEVLCRACPDGASAVSDDLLNAEFGNALIPAKVLKAGAEEAEDAVLRSQPEMALAIPGERADGEILEAIGLPVGAKDVLLCRKESGYRQ